MVTEFYTSDRHDFYAASRVLQFGTGGSLADRLKRRPVQARLSSLSPCPLSSPLTSHTSASSTATCASLASPSLPPLTPHSSGAPVTLTGSDLSLAQVAAIARHIPSPTASPPAPPIRLSASEHLRAAHDASRHVIASKVEAGLSIYGVSTGFGGSADTRTDDPVALGAALLQHQHAGVLTPSSRSRDASTSGMSSQLPISLSLSSPAAPLPLSDPTHSTTMPPAWTRAAMLVRTNSLLRGHSGVRWELVQKMVDVIEKGIVPLVPLRGSISASGG